MEREANSEKKYTIVLTEKGISYKVIKLVFHNEGFAFFMPYHSARSGVLTKLRLDYRKHEQSSEIDERVTFSSDDSVKLSYHNDGFIQFSSAGSTKIISGRDPVTKKAKGLGIMSNPLNDVIKSGPTFGATLWGLNDYLVYQNISRDKGIIEFDENDYYYRDSNKSDWDGYALEVFLFKYDECKAYIKQLTNNKYVLPILHNNYEIPNTLFVHRIIPNFSEEYVIGIIITRIKTRFSAPSGYCLNSASERVSKYIGYSLFAIYPSGNHSPTRKSIRYTGDIKPKASFIKRIFCQHSDPPKIILDSKIKD